MAHGWMPVSPCGPGCVGASMPTVRRGRRLLRLVSVAGALLAAALRLPFLGLFGGRHREVMVRNVFRGVLRAVGARLEIHGDATLGVPPEGGPHRGALVVDNHVSWLDIVAVNAVRPMRSVAKSEIETWPVVGKLAGKAGTVFLDRGSLRALPGTVAELAGVLRGGALVNACPEGTTWCGLGLGRFRPALFQAAIDGGVPVRPLVVRYRVAGAPTTWPAFVGDETLIDSARRTARLRGLVVEVHVLPEIAPGRARDRHHLAALAEAAVREVLHGTEPVPHPVAELTA
ncbi:MAG TPA: lysophospholipid acyltransferase family protein [Pseudonocardiaceae bacterium]|nr:lysophospholipid acyltransferase family protein [Pseudonocardiaceae bacterium]